MRSCVLALTVIALVAPSVAFAGDAKQDKKVVPSVAAKQMSETEMDKVTAGSYDVTNNGRGEVYESRVPYVAACSRGFQGNAGPAASTTC